LPDDELNQNPQGEELELTTARAIELEGLVAQKDEELAKAGGRITELEQAAASLDSEVVTLKQSLVESDEKLTKVNDSLAEAVASYRALAIQSNPGVVDQLISGDTIDDINESVEMAKTLIGKVREGLEAEIVASRVPAGAPQRTPPDLSGLSPREKIQYAIGGKR